jgi:ATP-dependent DNA ligase
MSTFCFIEPCAPVLAKSIPVGEQWSHEIKFDGYRVQAHKHGRDVEIFSRRGYAFTDRFDPLAMMLRALSAQSAPDFLALHEVDQLLHPSRFYARPAGD